MADYISSDNVWPTLRKGGGGQSRWEDYVITGENIT